MEEYIIFKKILYNSASKEVSINPKSLKELLMEGTTLSSCFLWDRSKEGRQFWYDISIFLCLYNPSTFHKFLLRNMKKQEKDNFIDISLFI